MKEMKRSGPGYEFGGLALDEEGGRRKATVVATKDSHFIVLDKESYQSIVGLEQKKKINKLMEMLTSTYYFQNVPKQILSTFVVFKHFEKHNFGDVIMKWKKKTDMMYVVFEGVVALIREKVDKPERREFKRFMDGTDPSKEIMVGDPLLAKGYKKIVVTEELCLREAGMSFGEEFVVLDIPAEYQAVARSKVVIVASISADVVRKKLFHFMPSCKTDFEQAVIQRYQLGFVWKKDLSERFEKVPSQVELFKEALRLKGKDNQEAREKLIGNILTELPAEGYNHKLDYGGLLR